ncbi:MAG: hypothetical protein U1E42_07885 [Rhodospirillales bacterium]
MIPRHIIRDHRRGVPFKIEADSELRAFVDDLLPHCTFAEVAAECVKRFGKERAPGHSAVHRYWLRRRSSPAATG